MDTSEYMPMFLAETREHLQALNLAVVRLEDDPTDRPTVDEVFRIAHSLKGMSATMGFAQMAELTHEMEDVFELLRQRTAGLEAEAIDTVFACLDVLSVAVDGIESDGQEDLDPEPLIARLRRLVRPRTPAQEAAREAVAQAALNAAVSAAQAAGQRVVQLRAQLADDAMMPAVRAHMLFAALGDHGEILCCKPEPHEIETFDGREVEAWLASEHEEETIAATAREVSEVVSAECVEMAAAPEAPASSPEAPASSPEAPASVPEAPAPAPAPAGPEDVEAPIAEEPVTVQPAAAEEPVVAPVPVEAPPPAAPGPVEVPTPAAPAPSAKPAHNATRTVRVDAERLDSLMDLMGELVIHRTAVEALTAMVDVPGLHQAVQELTRSSHALQAMVMKVRMIPVDVVFLRLPRLVRDLSSKLGKEVKLDLVGTDTELDRTVVDALGDPLVHLVRNSLDHGIEGPDQREAAGKPRVGRLEISARHEGRSVVISVTDDGHGLDPELIARKALEKGLIDEAAATELDMRGAIELLFAPGFSTAEAATDVSGRGVGMDAVRAQIRGLGGEVVMESTLGVGTTAQIRLPLTLAIVSALQVDIAGAPFAIPLDRVERTVRMSEQTVRSVAGRQMLVLEDGVLPLLDGARSFGRRPVGAHLYAVVVRAHDRRLALAVDDLVGQRELVTRPLPSVVADGEPVSAGAALADGQLALVVDCDVLASTALSGIQLGLTSPGLAIGNTRTALAA